MGQSIPKATFTWEEVKKHNTTDSCWVVADGLVFDVTEFLPLHPAGVKSIMMRAGGDATRDYRFHSAGSRDSVWKKYCIGRLAKERPCCPLRTVAREFEWVRPTHVDNPSRTSSIAEKIAAESCSRLPLKAATDKAANMGNSSFCSQYTSPEDMTTTCITSTDEAPADCDSTSTANVPTEDPPKAGSLKESTLARGPSICSIARLGVPAAA
jgi:hypothetical protein